MPAWPNGKGVRLLFPLGKNVIGRLRVRVPPWVLIWFQISKLHIDFFVHFPSPFTCETIPTQFSVCQTKSSLGFGPRYILYSK